MKLTMLLAAALTAFSLSAQAKTVEIHVTVDASQVVSGNSPAWYTGPSFALSVGDTLTVEFNFLPGQALQVSKPTMLGMEALAVDKTTSFDTVQLNSFGFIGLQGPGIVPPSGVGYTYGGAVMSIYDGGDFLATPDATISFTGLKFGSSITSYSDNVDHEFSNLYLFVRGDNIHAVTAVPEPSTYALLALGLGVVGLRARRKN